MLYKRLQQMDRHKLMYIGEYPNPENFRPWKRAQEIDSLRVRTQVKAMALLGFYPSRHSQNLTTLGAYRYTYNFRQGCIFFSHKPFIYIHFSFYSFSQIQEKLACSLAIFGYVGHQHRAYDPVFKGLSTLKKKAPSPRQCKPQIL